MRLERPSFDYQESQFEEAKGQVIEQQELQEACIVIEREPEERSESKGLETIPEGE